MIPYIEVFGFLFLGALVDILGKNERKKEMLFTFSIILLMGVIGLRAFVGWDFWAYYPSYNNLPSGFHYEIGYQIFSSLFYKLGLSYHHFTFINTVFDMLVLSYIFRKYSKYPLLSLFLFLSIQGLSLEVDLLRNMKALVIFLISIEFINKKQLFPFLILNIIGMSFHMSAIFYLPMYFILNKNYNKKIILGLIILGNIYYILDPKFIIHILEFVSSKVPLFLGEKIKNYLLVIPKDYKNFISPLYFERLITFIFVFLFIHKENENNSYSLIMENSFYIFYLIFLFTSEFFIASIRIGILFVFANWFLWGYIIKNLENKKIKYLAVAIMILISGNRIYNHFSFEGNKIMYRYENIISKHKFYEERLFDLKRANKFKDEALGKELLILY